MPISQDRLINLAASARHMLNGWNELRKLVANAQAQTSLGADARAELEAVFTHAQSYPPEMQAIEILIAEEVHFSRVSAHNNAARTWAESRRRLMGISPRKRPGPQALVAAREHDIQDEQAKAPLVKKRPFAEIVAEYDAEEARRRAAALDPTKGRIEIWRDEVTGEIIEDVADRIIASDDPTH